MILLGVTGGIGMGKSACADLLCARDVPVLDTDDLARQVVQPGQPALIEIQQAFGPAYIDPQGQLRRDKLGRQVFADPASRKKLEAILHPCIRALWRAQADDWRRAGTKIAAIIIPLLFETGAEQEFDAILCLACSAATQQARLATRGWSQEQIDLRNQAQMPVSDKQARSTYVIWTEGDLNLHAEQLQRILSSLASRTSSV